MLMRLRKWIEGFRQRKRERWEAERGNMSKEDSQVVDAYLPGVDPPMYSTKGFDETRRGRPN